MSDNLNQTLNIESENKSDDSINEQNISKFLEKIEGTIKQKEPEKITVDEDEPKKGIVGLSNMGNTCYLNSVIQILSNLPDFRQYLFDGSFVSNLKPELDDSLFYQTFRIIKHLWETTAENLAPKSFKKKFVEKQQQFMGFEQQDSHEAMQFLIDNLHEEIAQPIDINIEIPSNLNEFFEICNKYYNSEDKKKDIEILKFIDNNKEKALDYFACDYYKNLSKNYSEISELFQSINCNIIKCPDCNHCSYSFDKSYMISISLNDINDSLILESEKFKSIFQEKIEELKEKITDTDLIKKLILNEFKNKYIYKLNDLLENAQNTEQLDDDNLWFCDICDKKVKGLKQSKIYKHPKYMIIHIKRFKHIVHNGEAKIYKLKNLVGYNKDINIKDYMIKNETNTDYELVGGINHMGEYHFGHFTCFAKNNDKWYNYNDENVNEINCTDYPISPAAYMLIYQRKE
jgi:ubiquitin C-terminal hydrolase